MRTFIAIELTPDIKKTLSLFIAELDTMNKGSRNIKWISQEGMHLTLKFLGEIEKEKVPEIKNVLKIVSVKFKPFVLKFKGTGSFPSGKNPRILWVGIEEEGILNAFQYQLEKAIEELGFPREQRKFHPHLTLGRVKSFYNLRQTISFFEQHRERNFGEMKVEKIIFLRSILKPTGAEYSVLSESDLK